MLIDYLRRLYAARETRTLDLSSMKLKAIPPEVTNFSTLHELRLNDNEINTFPTAMSQLVDPADIRGRIEIYFRAFQRSSSTTIS